MAGKSTYTSRTDCCLPAVERLIDTASTSSPNRLNCSLARDWAVITDVSTADGTSCRQSARTTSIINPWSIQSVPGRDFKCDESREHRRPMNFGMWTNSCVCYRAEYFNLYQSSASTSSASPSPNMVPISQVYIGVTIIIMLNLFNLNKWINYSPTSTSTPSQKVTLNRRGHETFVGNFIRNRSWEHQLFTGMMMLMMRCSSVGWRSCLLLLELAFFCRVPTAAADGLELVWLKFSRLN